MFRTNRRQTLNDLTCWHNAQIDVLFLLELSGERYLMKGLSADNHRRQLLYQKLTGRKECDSVGRKKKDLTVADNQKNVIFNDETQTVIGKNKKIYVWRKDEVKYEPYYVRQYCDSENL